MKNMLFLTFLFLSSLSFAGSKVGNGDDGGDLENGAKIEKGPILESRKKAVELLNKLNVAGVPGLGDLTTELENSELYLSSSGVEDKLEQDKGIFHADMAGQVYARTFPRPHAPTRFFPVAQKLNEDQLVALHIHEALHRSLPSDIREDEKVVTEITLAIASPKASHDRVYESAKKYVKYEAPVPLSTGAGMTSGLQPIPETSRTKRPSVFGYTYKMFKDVNQDASYPLSSMHTLQSFMYPFGSDSMPIGIGIEASILRSREQSQMGPLSLSGRMMVWTVRGFDIGLWGVSSLNVLSNEEMKNSNLGRDILTAGISVRKEVKRFYVENLISYTLPSTAKQKIGQVEYEHDYGGIVTAGIHPGIVISKLHIGGFAEVYLADYYRVQGGAFKYDSGRYRIVAAGPEVSWVEKDFSVSVMGRTLIDSTQGANFDYIGNVMGAGVAQGYIGGGINVFF